MAAVPLHSDVVHTEPQQCLDCEAPPWVARCWNGKRCPWLRTGLCVWRHTPQERQAQQKHVSNLAPVEQQQPEAQQPVLAHVSQGFPKVEGSTLFEIDTKQRLEALDTAFAELKVVSDSVVRVQSEFSSLKQTHAFDATMAYGELRSDFQEQLDAAIAEVLGEVAKSKADFLQVLCGKSDKGHVHDEQRRSDHNHIATMMHDLEVAFKNDKSVTQNALDLLHASVERADAKLEAFQVSLDDLALDFNKRLMRAITVSSRDIIDLQACPLSIKK